MRILIGNHIDDSLLSQQDQRMFIQRIFWFIQEGDIVILPCPPVEEFLNYVLSFLGVSRTTVNVLQVPLGKLGEKIFDPNSLMEENFLKLVKEHTTEVTEIVALWPSPMVARFAKELNLSNAFPGVDFFMNGGGEIANSKASFRAFTSSLKCKIAPGGVCHDLAEAEIVIRELLQNHSAVAIKQVHNMAGAGNEVLYLKKQQCAGRVGMGHHFDLSNQIEYLNKHLEERWSWATSRGRFPVAIEAYIQNGRTIYAEFYVSENSVKHLACGYLEYENGHLVQESTPLFWLPTNAYQEFVNEGQRIAEFYKNIGYRGYLSTDAIYDINKNIWFTEVNARIGGSPHLYQFIDKKIVECGHKPNRLISQFLFNPAWKIKDTKELLGIIQASKYNYQSVERLGVIVTTPPVHFKNVKPFLFCIVHKIEENPQKLYDEFNKFMLEQADKNPNEV